MKKFFSLFMIAVMAVSFVGCGGSTPKAKEEPKKEEPKKEEPKKEEAPKM